MFEKKCNGKAGHRTGRPGRSSPHKRPRRCRGVSLCDPKADARKVRAIRGGSCIAIFEVHPRTFIQLGLTAPLNVCVTSTKLSQLIESLVRSLSFLFPTPRRGCGPWPSQPALVHCTTDGWRSERAAPPTHASWLISMRQRQRVCAMSSKQTTAATQRFRAGVPAESAKSAGSSSYGRRTK